MKPVQGRVILLSLAVILSVILFIPSTPLFKHMPGWWKEYLPSKGITLGLDLQGGIHLVMEVEEDRAVEIAVDRSVNSIQDFLVDKKIPVESVKRTGQTQVTIEFQKGDLKSEIQKILEEFPSFYEVEQSG